MPCELRGHHQQRAGQQVVHVHHLERGAVELRVLLGRADQRARPGGRVLDLVHQQLGLDRVVQPAQRGLEHVRARPCRAPGRATRCPVPPWTKTGASCQASGQPWSSSQSVTSSSASDVSIGSSFGALATCSTARCCSSMSASRLAGSVLAPGEQAQLAAHPGDPLAQARRRADGGGGRVVELVGQPRGQRAEREQPLPLADRLAGPLAAEEQPLEQVHRHREPLVHDLREAVRAEHVEPGRLGDPQRVAGRPAAPGRPGRP